MRALFISNDPSIFDTKHAAYARMVSYAKEIGTLHIISRGSGPRTKSTELSNGASLHLHSIGTPKLLVPLVMKSRARKIIRSERIEIVSAQDPFEFGWVATQAVKGTDAKLHLQLHTDVFSSWFTKGHTTTLGKFPIPFVNHIRQWIADRTLPKAHGIRVVSKRIEDSLIERYTKKRQVPLAPCAIIPVPVSSTLPPAMPLPLHPFTFTLITLGRLEPEKRIEDILQALVTIHAQYPTVGLLVFGEGRERARLELLAQKLGVSAAVMFLGYRHDALAIMQSGDLYIQASAYEGYSRTLLEAALGRLPIVTTDVGIVGEVFRGYEEVLASPVGDVNALVLNITALIEDVHARNAFVLNAERAARAHLESVHTSPTAIAQDLRNVLERNP